ncbi:hypothetical protein COCC4DRAFT_199649 [Bipolaris maydis ATCC 48331]|uniref:Uncharacterized protein n=2 Tax=Cochliobolus heterostrophus TaxID=5016 RepID=M2VAH9_COCH5|nr:uncharacterized protein COCC4DRAFT_199649 [Bipolaris maydis ATCC 48331]EMD96957.1 hypothetical protein COCHEDRAFT_1199772 [Bipolaris maydis C5]ENI03827.1 hypothetical protein COCC4DRAFT_199649 [Bipolaris maydis ATCC 48331]KAJ6211586.1 hypothetical protein PSV09DRAFT_1199772 [Bipolaris maydis]
MATPHWGRLACVCTALGGEVMRALTNALRCHVEGWWRLWFPARDEEPNRVESGPSGRRGLSNLSAPGQGGPDVAGAVEALEYGGLAPPQRAPVAYPQRGPPGGECLRAEGFYVWLATRYMGIDVSRAACGPFHPPWPDASMLGCTANALFRMLGVHRLLATPPHPAEARGLTSPGRLGVACVCTHRRLCLCDDMDSRNGSRAETAGRHQCKWPWQRQCQDTLHVRGAPLVAVMTPRHNHHHHHVKPATSVDAAEQRGQCARPDLDDDDSSRDGHESDHSSGLNLHRSPGVPGSQCGRAPLPRPPWPIHLVCLCMDHHAQVAAPLQPSPPPHAITVTSA